MGLEANIVYLEEEIASLRERLAVIREFLRANPSVSIYRRSIKGKIYYYKKYRMGRRSISEFLGASGFDIKAAGEKLMAKNEKIKRVRSQSVKVNSELHALQRQVRIARKACECV